MALGIDGITLCADPLMFFLRDYQDACEFFINCSISSVKAFAFDEATMRIQRVDSLAEAAQFYAPSDKQLCRCGRPFARYGDGSYDAYV